MQYIYYPLYILLFFGFSACNTKETRMQQPVSENDTLVFGAKAENDFSSSHRYPIEMHGIWGDISYLENLRRFNSVGEARRLVKFDTDIKVSYNHILVCRPDYLEASDFDEEHYELLFIEKESVLIEKDKDFGNRQKYSKIAELPDEDIWRLWGDEYSAISMMEWKWFEGKYEVTNLKDKTVKSLYFSDRGEITDEDKKYNYFFGTDSKIQDFIAFETGNNEYKYMLLEYKDGFFYCFGISGFTNWNEPLQKDVPEFKLRKSNN